MPKGKAYTKQEQRKGIHFRAARPFFLFIFGGDDGT
jgi:hypothetical protein